MAAQDWTAYLTAAKTALDMIKGIWSELPKSRDTEKAQHHIEQAEIALNVSKAELAKSLGHKLCQCTFPPQIMLWNAVERKQVCPVCGNTFPPPQPPQPSDDEDEYISVRR
jgi:hypothetical protein